MYVPFEQDDVTSNCLNRLPRPGLRPFAVWTYAARLPVVATSRGPGTMICAIGAREAAPGDVAVTTSWRSRRERDAPLPLPPARNEADQREEDRHQMAVIRFRAGDPPADTANVVA